MTQRMHLRVDEQSPIPIRRHLAEQLEHVIEGGGVPPDQPLPSIRELAGSLGINPNTVARVIEDLLCGMRRRRRCEAVGAARVGLT